MRIRVIDRLLILLAGLILLALTAALAVEAFLGWQVFGPVSEVMHRGDTVSLVIIAAAALALIPIVLYDRYAKRHEILTYTILRLF